jgi:hypothetical protein
MADEQLRGLPHRVRIHALFGDHVPVRPAQSVALLEVVVHHAIRSVEDVGAHGVERLQQDLGIHIRADGYDVPEGVDAPVGAA